MGLKNNDTNYRLVAREDIAANSFVNINADGKAQKATAANAGSTGVKHLLGFCPQEVKSGEIVPVIRSGKASGLALHDGAIAAVGYLYLMDDGKLDTTAAGASKSIIAPVLYVPYGGITDGDAFILTGNLDRVLAENA